MTDIIDLTRTERHALAEDLAGMDTASWQRASLCEGWTVEDCLAHLTQRNVHSPAGLAWGAVRHGGLQKFIDAGIAEYRGTTPEETLATFRETADRPIPRAAALQAYFGELVIHAEDIRRPLGLSHRYPAGAVGELLRTRGALARDLRRGLRLVADDADVVLGHGPTVHGPAISLLMCLSGRAAHASDLGGAGAAAFTARLTA